MARNKRKEVKAAETRKDAEFRGFANIRLNESELELVAGWTESTLADYVEGLLDVGKVTLNVRDGAYSCTCTIQIGDDAGYAVSSFSDTAIDACALTYYKVTTYKGQMEELSKAKNEVRRG